MKIRKRRHGLCYLVDESESTSSGGGEPTPFPAPTEASTDASQPGEMPGEPNTDDQPTSRPTLSDLVTKHLGDDKPAEKDAAEPAVKPVAEPPQPPSEKPTDQKPDEAKPEGDKPADEARPDDKPEGEPEKFELLSKEDIDKKFSNSPKGLRQYTSAVTEKYQELEKTVDDFGGPQALKTLEAVALNLTQTTPEAARELQERLQTRNPKLLAELQTDIFNGALDQRPELIESVIKSNLRSIKSSEQLKMLDQAITDGDIDLEEVENQQKARLLTKDPEAHKQIEELRGELTALKGDGTEVKETKEQGETRMRIQADVADLRVRYHDQTVNPVLQLHGFIPGKDTPEPVANKVNKLANFIRGEIQAAVNKNQSWKNLDGMISSGLKGDVYEWELDRAMKAASGLAIETALEWQPILNAYLASVNSSVATRNKERPPSAKDEAIEEAPPNEIPKGISIGDMDPEQRRAHMASLIRAKQGNSASA